VVIKQPPKDVTVNTHIPMVVALEDKKHQIVTTDDGFFIEFTRIVEIGEGAALPAEYVPPRAKN